MHRAGRLMVIGDAFSRMLGDIGRSNRNPESETLDPFSYEEDIHFNEQDVPEALQFHATLVEMTDAIKDELRLAYD